MNFSIVLCFIVVVYAGACTAQIGEYVEQCSVQHSIPPTQIVRLRATQDKSTVNASENLKFSVRSASLCVIEKTAIVDGSAVNVGRVIQFAQTHFGDRYDEGKTLAKIAECGAFYNGYLDCSTAWKLQGAS